MLRLLVISALLSIASVQAQSLYFVTEDFPPFNYPSQTASHHNTLNVAGPMVDMIQAACAHLAITCSIELLPWQRALSRAEQGEAEGIFTVIDSAERQQTFYISRMLIKPTYSLYAHQSNGFAYNELSELAGRNIAVYGPSGTSYTVSQHWRPSPVANSNYCLATAACSACSTLGALVLKA